MKSIRSCIACGKKLPKERLCRIAKFKGDMIEVSRTGGRGAYICDDKECLGKAFKGDKLARALRIKSKIDLQTLRRLREEIEVIIGARRDKDTS